VNGWRFLYNLDMARISVVKTNPDQKGATYEDMPWETKQSFHALAEYYSKS